jgi:peptide deformylase
LNDDIRTFIDDMKVTMLNAEGIGLAANQVGSPLSITIIDISPVEGCESIKPLTMINPKITHYSDEETDYEEGCLSLPNLRELVIRPEAIQVSFMDEHEKLHTMEADGLLARVMQHEIDGLLIEANQDELTSAMRFMIKNPEKRNRMAQAFHDKVMHNHTWTRVAQQILASCQ